MWSSTDTYDNERVLVSKILTQISSISRSKRQISQTGRSGGRRDPLTVSSIREVRLGNVDA